MNTGGPKPPRSPFRADWMAADLRGTARDLTWYVEQAKRGDQEAARRALQWLADSLSPEALAQSGGISPTAAAVLREITTEAARGGDAPLMRTARELRHGRPKDHLKTNALWWVCVDLHHLLLRDPALTQEEAADRVLAAPGISVAMEPRSLLKEYRKMRDAIERYLEDDDAS